MRQFEVVEKSEVAECAEYCEKKFSKILDDEAKSRLESRFFAADDKTTSATQTKEQMLDSL
jgi:hypothetical protein